MGANDGMVHAFLLSVYDSVNQSWATYAEPQYPGDTNSYRTNTLPAGHESDKKNRAGAVGLYPQQSFGPTPGYSERHLRSYDGE